MEIVQPPSHNLSDANFISLIALNIRGTHNIERESIDEKMKEHSDILGKELRRRLARHIRTKIPDPSKFNHPALLFVRVNLNCFVAMLCYFNQARCSCVININTCLLKNPIVGGFMLAEDEALEGSYLQYCNEDGRWIRTGKAVGSNASDPVNGLVLRNKKDTRRKQYPRRL